MNKYVIGLDFGTDSVRAVLISTSDGTESASEVFCYPRWKAQKFCIATKNQFRQHPLDHIEGLQTTIVSVIQKSKISAEQVLGICIDTTGSSPMAITENGEALALTKGFEENPNAMIILWKDHTAVKEANEINDLARNWGGENFTKYEGGIYSSEWFWAKILHVIREDEVVKNAAFTWMENCDYMTYLLADQKDLTAFKRSRCAAGHKAMWHKSWGGLPSKSFLSKLDSYLAELKDNLYVDTFTSDQIAGYLNAQWAQKLGLTTNTVIAVGTFDAHAGAIGAKVDKNSLVRVMGTSTCDIMVSPYSVIGNNTVKGICGQVDGSVIPGMIGLEAGQSAFGDVLAWFKTVLSWPIDNLVMKSDILTATQKEELQQEIDKNFIQTLAQHAERISLSDAIPVALDWVNGRRTPDTNQELKSAFTGISLGTKAPHLFKALVNAICFGSKMIVNRFEEEGVQIHNVIGIGGVARKSPFIMQTLANVLNKPIKVVKSNQTPALGAAIYAATAAGVYDTVINASKVMGSDFEAEYFPQTDTVTELKQHIEAYKKLGFFVEQLTKKISKDVIV
ncbi:ribulokinase [Croceivirga lutea]|uniref:ribulokinase n=1 Tax=Croceivirga lutea TaxID=1775167 RepID=UPI00163B23E5|nr:ribulokinase [Croceivirga lutea]GGG42135.1 ribulokinase [Croceivirga lutea]